MALGLDALAQHPGLADVSARLERLRAKRAEAEERGARRAGPLARPPQ